MLQPQAKQLTNDRRRAQILLDTEGPTQNVIKLKNREANFDNENEI
jgi:hypothetical protein